MWRGSHFQYSRNASHHLISNYLTSPHHASSHLILYHLASSWLTWLSLFSPESHLTSCHLALSHVTLSHSHDILKLAPKSISVQTKNMFFQRVTFVHRRTYNGLTSPPRSRKQVPLSSMWALFKKGCDGFVMTICFCRGFRDAFAQTLRPFAGPTKSKFAFATLLP